jgi:hypothetical protein
MGGKKKSTTPESRKLIVEIPTHDDHGNPITDAMLSSGGARAHGPLVKQYFNPQPYEPTPVRSDEDREFDAYMQRERDREQRREDLAEERRRRARDKLTADLIHIVADHIERFALEVFFPWAGRKWEERKALKLELRESKAAESVAVDSPSEDERALIVVDTGTAVVESATVENIAPAPVVQIEDYRRSA